MKKMNFLSRLSYQRKLELREPSEEIKDSYEKKSESNLIAAKILVKNKKFEEAVGLTYYSMYHQALALFAKVGIKCENHTATIRLLKEIFKIENKQLEDAKSEREDKQYYTDFKIVQEDVKNMVKTAERFNQKLYDLIVKIDAQKVEEYRKELKELLK